MRGTADVVVVGGGLFGCSAAFALTRAGAGKVVLVERGQPAAGESGRCVSMFRRHYSNPVTVQLAMRGCEVIKNWAQEVGAGDSGYVETGYLLSATAEKLEALRGNIAMQRGLGLDTRFLAPEQIREVEPLMSVEGVAGGAYEADGGFADATKMCLGWFAAAIGRGVEAETGCAVTALRASGGRVTGVSTSRGDIDAPVVVMAAGEWSRGILAPLGVDLPVRLRRIQVALIRRPRGVPRVSLTVSDIASNLVFRPDRGGLDMVVTYFKDDPIEDPDQTSWVPDPGYEQAVRRSMRERVPSYTEFEYLGGWAGNYDYTPDWNPIVGWAPEIEGLYLATATSGHGFKLAPPIGEAVAAAVTGSSYAIDMSPLRPERFAQGDLLKMAYGPGARA